MSSLRDQLLQAGFKEPAKKSRSSQASKQKNQARQKSRQESEAHARAETAKRKALKEKIAALINEHHAKDYNGEVVCHYTVGSRIRQLHLKEDVYKKLTAGELVITRLNGKTFLIATEISEQILALNPDWAVFRINDKSDTVADDGYEEFPVPDDLQW